MNSTVGASGEIYIDDGVSIEPSSAFDVTLVAVGNNLTAQSTGNYPSHNPLETSWALISSQRMLSFPAETTCEIEITILFLSEVLDLVVLGTIL